MYLTEHLALMTAQHLHDKWTQGEYHPFGIDRSYVRRLFPSDIPLYNLCMSALGLAHV